jgi:hypothetical protein
VEFAAVLTRMRRGLFVVGGDDVTTGTPTGEIWFTSLEGGDWVEVASAIRPQEIRAATYSFRTRNLYFLDEVTEVPADPNAGSKKKATVCHVPAGHSDDAHTISIGKAAVGAHLAHGDTLGPCPQRRIRLVEVDVDGLGARVIFSSKPPRKFDQFFLTVDRDGGLLLSASSRKKHRIGRVDLGGAEPALAGILKGKRALAFPPVVDADGYTLVFHGKEEGTVKRVRVRNLELHAAQTLFGPQGDEDDDGEDGGEED